MARPTKQGVDYFPLDVQFDDKIELLIAEHGAIALSVLVTIWQLIYQNDGYFITWNDDLALLVKRRIMVEEPQINIIIHAALKRKIFDNTLNNDHGILTSKAIQKRYFLVTKKKKMVSVNQNYILDGVSVGENSVYIGVDDAGNATKGKVKVKEKGKEEADSINSAENPPAQILQPEELQKHWNAIPGVLHCEKITGPFRQTINARIRDHPKLEWWLEYLDLVKASDFLCGRNDRGWAASFDWVCGPKNMSKVLAGTYVNVKKGKNPESKKGSGLRNVRDIQRDEEAYSEMPEEARKSLDRILGKTVMP